MTSELAIRQPQHTFAELERMAIAVSKSGLFGVKTPEAALTLMLIAQEEGTGVAAACRDFHIIEGKPSLKVDAMLARFQASGGQVEWHVMTDQKVEATFSHPSSSPLKLEWTWEMAVRAKLSTKDNWVKYPRAMLRSRVVSEGIHAVAPGSVVGVYTPDELEELRDVTPPREPARAKVDEPIDVDTTTGEIITPPTAEPTRMDEGVRADFLATIDSVATLDDLKIAHSKAYAAGSAAGDGSALLAFEVAKKKRKYELTKGGEK